MPAKKNDNSSGQYFTVDTWLGEVAVAFQETKVVGVVLPSRDFGAPKKAHLAVKGFHKKVASPSRFKSLSQKLIRHLDGTPQSFADIELATVESGFQAEVHAALCKTKPGTTLTYGELAARTGDANRARAVGTAMSTNPIPILVPCHRVFSGDGFGAYSGGAGLSTKLRILYQEGFRTAFSNVTWNIDQARHALSKDRALAALFARTGPFMLEAKAPTTRTRVSPLDALSKSVLYQQLAGAAAATIERRLEEALTELGASSRAEALSKLPQEKYRDAGVSTAKEATLRALAVAYQNGTLPTRKAMESLSDDEIRDVLTQIRGIGPWSCEMLKMFYLGRPDVFPSGDLGVQKGYERVYGHALNAKELARWSERFTGHRTLLAWYLWRATELPKEWNPSAKRAHT